MQIKPGWRDAFPKMDLHDNYVGDGYPLCAELPPRAFLRAGARYRFLGYSPTRATSADSGSSMAKEQSQHPWTPGHFPLEPASALWPLLCPPGGGGGCAFASEVTLESNLACHGTECGLDTLSLLNVTAGGVTGYYEYVRVACVELAFFDGGRWATEWVGTDTQLCVNPREEAAGAACCPPTGDGRGVCSYFAELVRFDTAAARCDAKAAAGDYWGMCTRVKTIDGCGYDYGFSWVDRPCEVRVQVRATGHVSLVHEPTTSEHLSLDSQNLFRVRWREGRFPVFEEGCAAGCEVHTDTCLCNVTLSRNTVYLDGDALPSAAEIDHRIGLGAPAPDAFDAGAYSRCETAACLATDAEVWVAAADGGLIGPATIFGVTRNGTFTVHLANAEAMVHVGGGHYSFRNPPHFMSLVGTNAAARDAAYETEAVLRHFSSHQNAPPFLAHRLIQRLVTSNPSPRYVKAVATAFANGSYTDAPTGVGFGGGAYGDLGAAIAAILLDREARSPELDADPTHGQLREPLLKLVHVLRALEYRSVDARLLQLRYRGSNEWIGQQPYGSPSVFNFYLPEYQPPGAVQAAGLVSPEAQLATTPMILAFLNDMVALVRDGLSSCKDGMAGDTIRGKERECKTLEQRRATADGNLTFVTESDDASGVVDELGLLLTAGRLSNHSRQLLVKAYEAAEAEGGEPLTRVEELMLAAPEFHSSNHPAPETQSRGEAAGVASQERPYKAIVVLFLHGGADSYNLIVPHSACSASDLYAEYAAVRGPAIAIAKDDLLPFNVSAGSQPCATFGLHPELPFVHSLYQQGEAVFVANVGALVEPLTKSTWKKEGERPNALFAHNAQQKCAANVHAQSLSADGVLGRIAQTLTRRDKDPYSVGAYSIRGNQKILENGAVVPNILSRSGSLPEFEFYDDIGEHLVNLTRPKAGSIFSETISEAIGQSLVKNRELAAMLGAANVTRKFKDSGGANTDLGKQLMQVAKVIDARKELGAERDVFFVSIGGFDTHSDEGEKLASNFKHINKALEAFVTEMRDHGVWDQVTLATLSDFGRTLTSNGRGSAAGFKMASTCLRTSLRLRPWTI